MAIALPAPQLQIDFAFALEQIRAQSLQEALFATIAQLPVSQIDRELAKSVPTASLTKLASHGLRGEMLFPVPCLIRQNPRLLGYYRLLLGFSQKAFYASEFGLTGFKAIEEGTLSRRHDKKLEELCQALVRAGAVLLEGIGARRITGQLLSDLTLLTLGPQLRGGHNVKIHNRIGEAEKSHQKARSNGFVECWTVVNVNRIDLEMARRESPSTNRFYRLSQIEQSQGEEREDFVARVLSLTSIAVGPTG